MSKDNEYAVDHTQELYDRFMNLAINRFKWEGLPEGVNTRIIETFLIEHGMVAVFNDKEKGMYCLPCSGVAEYNVYSEPTEYNVVGYNYNERISADDCIIIRNNARGKGDKSDLQLFADRINEVEQIMDVNLLQQGTPFVFLTDEKERLTVKNIFNQIRKHKFAIFGSKNIGISKTEVLPTTAPYLLDKLQTHKNSLMNELLTFLGINNNNIEKKERLLVDEVNSNNDFILVNIDHMYEERIKAVEEVNKKFGLNITVEKREVDLNGRIHDNTETND